MLALLLNVVDAPVVARVGTTWMSIDSVRKSEGRYVLELDPEDMQTAVEHLVIDSATAAKARAMPTKNDEAADAKGASDV
ncbi:hypothetical protein [Actinoplanes sp. DH11]|uniref:hypothetical protein n=1 Tax=Actinoplanes sp. DH11 TaxID=2857011 RepID=UPI001E63B4D2|nr:hypothetical protein [Actinoplanes sp. DH11]